MVQTLMRNSHWNEKEVTAAVEAYFKMLHNEQNKKPVNKAQVYKGLSKSNPDRSPKAFERKLQNISAILYELKMPYCTGLKPSSNYQGLLKKIVINYLQDHPQPKQEPYEILLSMLKNIKSHGPIKIKKKGSGRYGLAIEDSLGIPQNSDKSADFMGIELKTKGDLGLQTLFSRTPSTYGVFQSKLEMFKANCYFDNKKNRKALYTSFNSNGDPMGFRLSHVDDGVCIFRNNILVMTFSGERIEEALVSKHSQTAFIELKKLRIGGEEYCEIQQFRFCESPSIEGFMRLVESGCIHLDLTMSINSSGKMRDHGFLWRVQPDGIGVLYKRTRVVGL